MNTLSNFHKRDKLSLRTSDSQSKFAMYISHAAEERDNVKNDECLNGKGDDK